MTTNELKQKEKEQQEQQELKPKNQNPKVQKYKGPVSIFVEDGSIPFDRSAE